MNFLFKEVQRFRQKWLWLLLIFPFGLISLIMFTVEGSLESKLIGILAVLGSLSFLLIMKLTTKISGEGIHYRFFPFHLKEQFISWSDVDRAYVRKYSPIGEYGGWGIRFGFGNGKAYNVSGDIGLQLKLKNGKHILFGTKKEEELKKVMEGLYEKGIMKGA